MIAGGIGSADGQHFQTWQLNSLPPVSWTAAGAGLTFNFQAIDATQQNFQVSWAGAVPCGRAAGAALLVRPVDSSFYMTPGGGG